MPATSTAVTPNDLAVDAAGNLLLTDSFYNAVRVVANTTGTFYGVSMVAGDVYTLAGRGKDGLGDGGPASGALFQPSGIAALASGAVDVETPARIRQITG